MVYVRLNEREANPNPHVNFIIPLKMEDPTAEEEARRLLRALAAQVRPVMKAEGFMVNSFEEYQHNQVFAGRNWNNGAVVELVLRRAGGSFYPISWLLSILCHELAHIKHTNHGPAFQTLWAKLRKDVNELQSKGYYGDEYWSSGTRLSDSVRIDGQGIDPEDLPEYMCGGAQTRTRPTSLRRRRAPRVAGPSYLTGAQTAKKQKPGTRVRAKGAFKGAGKALNEDIEDEEQKKAGTGFRKKAGSKRAREERALAAERRLLVLQEAKDDSSANKDNSGDEELEYEEVNETDQDRRRAVLESTDKSELDGLKIWQRDYSSDFIFPPVGVKAAPLPEASSSLPTRHPKSDGKHQHQHLGSIDPSSDDDPPGCDVQLLPQGGTVATSAVSTIRDRDHDGKKRAKQTPAGLEAWLQSPEASTATNASHNSPKKKQQELSYGALVQEEIHSRRKESLGMNATGRLLGGTPSGNAPGAVQDVHRERRLLTSYVEDRATSTTMTPTVGSSSAWTCQVCTLVNEPTHVACSACSTPRGESSWVGNHV